MISDDLALWCGAAVSAALIAVSRDGEIYSQIFAEDHHAARVAREGTPATAVNPHSVLRPMPTSSTAGGMELASTADAAWMISDHLSAYLAS